MSGHWRFCVAAFLVFAGLSTLPAFSNPLTDLFDPAPKEAAAPTPAKEACIPQPGNSAAPGQHWFYHVDGHRKCWFQAAGATASAKRQVHHHVAKRPVIARDADEELHSKTVMDAHDQLLSAAAEGASQPTAPAPEVVDEASLPAAVPSVPAAPVVAEPAINQLTSDHAAPRSVDVEMLLADSSLAKDTVASSKPPTTADPPATAGVDKNHRESTATPAGFLLIALGLVFLAGSLLTRRFRNPILISVGRA